MPHSVLRHFGRVCLLAFVCSVPVLRAATYYISPTGSDSNSGTSPATPWQTLAKVNGATFAAGDQILFESGKTFVAPSNSDALIIKGAGSSNTNRITYGIYGGTARAVIQQNATNRNGVKFAATNDWVTVQDLEIAGPFAWTPSAQGAVTPYGVHLQGSSSNVLQGTTLQRLVVRNFRGSGIRSNQNEKLSDTRIQYTEVYEVGDGGIRLGSDFDTQNGEFRQNIYVGYCYVHHTSGFDAGTGNHNGDGIQIACAKNVVVEYCVVHDTATAFYGNAGGPVGIWFADVHDGVIQFNEVYRSTNGTSSSDGGGIDLDGGCRDCVVQYNYTHDSEGAGYLLAHWSTSTGGGSPTERNTFRYNISINDNTVGLQGGIAIWSAGGANSLEDNRFHNNLIVSARGGARIGLVDPAFKLYSASIANTTKPVQIYNNIFITAHGHQLSNTQSRPNVVIRNNLWWALDGNFVYPVPFAQVDADGIEADPLIANIDSLYNAPTIGFSRIDRMHAILAEHFKILPGSPAIDAGRDKDLLGNTVSVGIRDFFNNIIPQSGAFDIGHHEFAPLAAGRIALSAPLFSGVESGSITLTLRRLGGAAGSASVRVTTFDGQALAGADYDAIDTVVLWTDGDSADKTVTITLTDDSAVEGDEVFTVSLSDPTGADISGSGIATLTIHDNDAGPAATYINPLDIVGTDPSVTAGGDGKFYLYYSNSGGVPGTGRMESVNLVDWSNAQTAYADTSALSPHIAYDPLGRDWWFFGHLETARGPSAAGPFTKQTDNWGSAPWHFVDPADGRSYLFTGSGTTSNRHKIERLLNNNQTSRTVYPHFIESAWGSGWESPVIFKHGDLYYWLTSAGSPTTGNYSVVYATSSSVEGPWVVQSGELGGAFFRQSILEGIYGPGSPGLYTDIHGTRWLYYQQKQTNTTATDARISLDPIWIDTSGVIHGRPTRGVSRPGPNSPPSALWPAVAAGSVIEAESYAGSAIGTLSAGGSGTVVSALRGRAFLAYRNLDFGVGYAAFQANLSSGLADTGTIISIEIRTGGVNGPLVGVLPVSRTGNWNTYQTQSVALSQTLSGVHDIFLVVHGVRPATELLRLDWFSFTSTAAANANLPPVAASDDVLCVQNGSVTFNVLANDTDPENTSLVLTGTGNSSSTNRSFRAPANNLVWNADGTVTYTAPSATFWGDDQFYYSVRDADGGYSTGIVRVRVTLPGKIHRDYDGLVVIEAEDFNALGVNNDTNGDWFAASSVSGYAGTGYVTTAIGAASTVNNAAYLDYAIDVRTAGSYVAWVRCSQTDANSNASQFSLTTGPSANNADRASNTFDNLVSSGWYWRKIPGIRTLRPGIHRLRISRQDSGHALDRIVFTTDETLDPSFLNAGVGPLAGGVIAFDEAAVSVAENAGSVSVSVHRSGVPEGVASVNYATASGTAVSGSDFTSTSGTLSWADGESGVKTIVVPIINDAVQEDDEAFTLTLSGVSGATLGSQTSVVVTITDDDSAPAGYAAWSAGVAWNGADSSPSADPDGDGIANLLEYALATQPVSASEGVNALPVVSRLEDGRLSLSFDRAQADLVYIVQASSDLKAWTDIATNPGDVGQTVTVTDTDTTSTARYLRMKVVLDEHAVLTVPEGRLALAIAGNQDTSISFPLHDTGSASGQMAGFITAVGVNTLDNAHAAWTAGELSQAAAPWLLRVTSGAAAGRLFTISTVAANTAVRVTLLNAGTDLTTLGIVPGADTYELIPADTIAGLFPSGALQSGTTATADLLMLWNGSAWLTYYHDGTQWMRQGVGPSGNTIVRPDQGWLLRRRGGSLSIVLDGRVPSTAALLPVAKGNTSFVGALPVPLTFAEWNIQALPGWTSQPANPASGDHVKLWNGSAWLTYYHDGSQWMRQGVGPASATQLNRPGRPIMIVRPSGSGTDFLINPKSY